MKLIKKTTFLSILAYSMSVSGYDPDPIALEILLDQNTCNVSRSKPLSNSSDRKINNIAKNYKDSSTQLRIEELVKVSSLGCFESYNLTFFYALITYQNEDYNESAKLFDKLLQYEGISENNQKIIDSRVKRLKKQIRLALETERQRLQREAAEKAAREEAQRIVERNKEVERQKKERELERRLRKKLEEEAKAKERELEERIKKEIAERKAKEEETRQLRAKIEDQNKQLEKVENEATEALAITQAIDDFKDLEKLFNLSNELSDRSEVVKGVIECEKDFKNDEINKGRSNVKLKCYSDGVTLYSETNYKDGKKQGEEKSYFKDGKLRTRSNFNLGKLDGLYEVYSLMEDQSDDSEVSITHYKAFQGYYSEGTKQGKHVYYFSNQRLGKREFYESGVLEGEVVSYFKNGQLEERTTYKTGVFDGPFERYLEDGQPVIISNFKNGLKDGQEEIYHKETGQVLSRINYLRGDFNGPFEEFYPDGVVRLIGEFSRNKRVGLWEAFFNDGTLQLQTKYRNGKLNGIMEQYYEEGTLKVKVKYSNDKKNGEEVFFDKEGNVKNITSWRMGRVKPSN